LARRADGGYDLRFADAPPLHLEACMTCDSNRFIRHGLLRSRRFLHNPNLRLGQAVQLVDQPALLPVRRCDLTLQAGLGVGGFGI